MRYAFVTVWHTSAPVDLVWQAITRVEDWPAWWRGVKRVNKVRDGDDRGIGALHEFAWRGRLPYDLIFTTEIVQVVEHRLIVGHAQGELEGIGRWTFTGEEGGTRVECDWRVRTTKRWMNLLAPIAYPLFVWNHNTVMRWGAEGLGRVLGAKVQDQSRRVASNSPRGMSGAGAQQP